MTNVVQRTLSKPYLDLFAEINKHLTVDWNNKKILDYGGNHGRLLASSNGEIKPKDYTSMDVVRGVLDAGKERFPDATWILVDDYNQTYNPRGTGDTNITESYDIIVCTYMFLYCTEEETKHYINHLYNKLKPGGKLICNIGTIRHTLSTLLRNKHMPAPDIINHTNSLQKENLTYMNYSETSLSLDNYAKAGKFFCLYNSGYFITEYLDGYNFEYKQNPDGFDYLIIVR